MLRVESLHVEANQTVRVTVIQQGANVTVYRNGIEIKQEHSFQQLDYTNAQEMVVGYRTADEYWRGTLGPVLISPGAIPMPTPGQHPLDPKELAALQDI